MSQNGKPTLKILLQDFQSVFGHFGTLCIKGLTQVDYLIITGTKTTKRIYLHPRRMHFWNCHYYIFLFSRNHQLTCHKIFATTIPWPTDSSKRLCKSEPTSKTKKRYMIYVYWLNAENTQLLLDQKIKLS